MIRLLKTVYTGQIFVSNPNDAVNIAYDLNGSSLVNRIFKNSYFNGIPQMVLPELTQSIISVPDVYEALKNKADAVEVQKNGQIVLTLEGTTDRWHVGEKVSDEENKKLVGEAFTMFEPFHDMLDAIGSGRGENWEYSSILCGSDIIERLINYETVTIRDPDVEDVGIILTSKCFPSIKKCDGIQAEFIYSSTSERFMTVMSSRFFNTVTYRMLVDTLKC